MNLVASKAKTMLNNELMQYHNILEEPKAPNVSQPPCWPSFCPQLIDTPAPGLHSLQSYWYR